MRFKIALFSIIVLCTNFVIFVLLQEFISRLISAIYLFISFTFFLYWLNNYGYSTIGFGTKTNVPNTPPVIYVRNPNGESETLRFICISDTHGKHRELSLPKGDVLLVAGDFTWKGKLEEIHEFNQWLKTLPFRYIVVIGGNYEYCLDTSHSGEYNAKVAEKALTNCIYLIDSHVTIHGIKIYGSPFQPKLGNMAFNLNRGAQLKRVWDKIPEDTNILLTHTPPLGYGDRTFFGKHVGCEELAKAVKRIKPQIHVFGHIHEGYGIYSDGNTIFMNSSTCTLLYDALHEPLVFDVRIN